MRWSLGVFVLLGAASLLILPRIHEVESTARIPAADQGHQVLPSPTRQQLARLLEVDLSDEALQDSSFEEVWGIGVEYLGWPNDAPAGTGKGAVQQELLRWKYLHTIDIPDVQTYEVKE